MIHLSFADKRAEEAVAVPHQSFNQVRDEASGGAWPRLGEIITSGENIEIRFLFTLMKCYFQGGPPDEHHFLLFVPKVTVGIFISSSPGTSRAGGNLNSLSINLLHAVLLPLLLIPPSLLTDKYFIAWTRDEHSPVSFTSPGRSSRSRHCVAGAVSTHHHPYLGFFFMNLRQSALDAGEW